MPALCTARAAGLYVFLLHKNQQVRAMRSHSLHELLIHVILHLVPKCIFSNKSPTKPGHSQSESPLLFFFTNGILTFCFETRVLLTVNL